MTEENGPRQLRHRQHTVATVRQVGMLDGDLRAGVHDTQGDLRAIELKGHPFLVATLFQPERAALEGRTPALASAFLAACASQRP